nr:MAG TPA: InsA C-terminal domain [Caudoviricetes sp.]
MAKLKDLADQVGRLEPEKGKTLLRSIQDNSGVYDGRNEYNSKYAEHEILEAVALYRLYGSYPRVSEMTGIPPSTIQSWVSGKTNVLAKIVNVNEKIEKEYKLMLQNNLMLMNRAQQVIYEKLPQSSAAQAATIYGIIFDKNDKIMNGRQEQHTTNLHINVGNLSAEEQYAILDRALQRQEQRTEEIEAIDTEYSEVRQEDNEE